MREKILGQPLFNWNEIMVNDQLSAPCQFN